MPEKRRPAPFGSARKSAPPKSDFKKPQPQPEPEIELSQSGFITSLENDKAKFVRLLLNKKERYASRHFLIEGVRLVKEALKAAIAPTFTLFEPDSLRKTESGRSLLFDLSEMVEQKKGAYPVTERIIAAASDTVTPQGVAAAIPFLTWEDEQFAAKKLHLILDGVQDPGNLGTVLRSAWASGNAAVWLTESSVDFYSPKAVRAGMGAHFHVPTRFDQKWADLVKQLQNLGIKQVLLAEGEISEGGESRASYRALPGVSLYEVDWNQPTAIIIGNEAHGPSADGWKAANSLLHIPMPGGAESLNASIAASLIIFEALRQQSN
jgi:TrmH family RNA methyltransferase